MKILKKKRAYLSGPIEHNPDANWREEPKKELSKRFGLKIFDPFSDPKQDQAPKIQKARENNDLQSIRKIAKGFVHKDLAKVDRADILIAYLPYKIYTVGTVHEIINSNDRKKPTLLICPEGVNMIPFWYFGFIKPQFMFGSWQELYNYLEEVNDGLHKDDFRWAFVYGLV